MWSHLGGKAPKKAGCHLCKFAVWGQLGLDESQLRLMPQFFAGSGGGCCTWCLPCLRHVLLCYVVHGVLPSGQCCLSALDRSPTHISVRAGPQPLQSQKPFPSPLATAHPHPRRLACPHRPRSPTAVGFNSKRRGCGRAGAAGGEASPCRGSGGGKALLSCGVAGGGMPAARFEMTMSLRTNIGIIETSTWALEHEEPFDVQVPSVPGRQWGRVTETSRPSPQDILEPGREQPIAGDRDRIEGRSLVGLMSQEPSTPMDAGGAPPSG
jgi:hypothetical protein